MEFLKMEKYKPRVIAEGCLIAQHETQGDYKIYSLKRYQKYSPESCEIRIPQSMKWKKMEYKKNMGCIFYSEKKQCMVLFGDEKVLGPFDSIEVFGNKIRTTEKEEWEWLYETENVVQWEMWFNEKGEKMVTIAKKKEGLYTVHFPDDTRYRNVQHIESVLDDNGNVRGLTMTNNYLYYYYDFGK